MLIAAVGLLVVLTCLPAAEAATTGYGAAGATLAYRSVLGRHLHPGQREHQRRRLGHVPEPGTSNGRLSTFGFVIPSSATITGIEVEVEGNEGTGTTPVTYAVAAFVGQRHYLDRHSSRRYVHRRVRVGCDARPRLGGPADNWGYTWSRRGWRTRSTDAIDSRFAFSGGGPAVLDDQLHAVWTTSNATGNVIPLPRVDGTGVSAKVGELDEGGRDRQPRRSPASGALPTRAARHTETTSRRPRLPLPRTRTSASAPWTRTAASGPTTCSA